MPQFCEVIPVQEIAPCLNLGEEKFSHDIQVVSTGLRKIFAPICDLPTLESIVPNYDNIIEVSKKYTVTGIYCFTLQVESCTARCRNFAPLVGIYEDAATGTSAAALSCYLVQHRLQKVEACTQFSFEQGYSIAAPSLLKTRLQIENEQITHVEVAGRAQTEKCVEWSNNNGS